MKFIAHVSRDETDSFATVVLPDRFADIDAWEMLYGDQWCETHFSAADAWVAIQVGWEWVIHNCEWVTNEEFLSIFEQDSFLEEVSDE